ncbi:MULTISPECIES: DUF6221 family protein [Streptomyces]|uniref:Uncharacterized protein n=1 Tax=Streptomyces dengpaensis TaxID=2049881 RepID=A0ABN5I5Q8_9ACTN|nr:MULTISPECIES: DUF6221 family protein [Streptomyces]AVH58397.1 hypothetical protein C4B68_24455 [Streptomyces dengpaensis]PIB06072.1 hypothetical protein B1C81_26175 [Streptomyces sp. HG99]
MSHDIDMVRFLRNRYDEDERTARAAMWDEESGVWTARPPQASYERYTVADYCDDGVVVVTPENADADGVGRHIERHDPARVLREVDAKRRILDDYERYAAERRRELGGWNTDEVSPILTALAVVYADHPDYRPEWGL